MPGPHSISNRIQYQWDYLDAYHAFHPQTDPPKVLNLGCADDPAGFGELVLHVDIDDWSYLHRYFVQADIQHLPFADRSYDLVIMGDVLEHIRDPKAAVEECLRVLAPEGRLVMTVFEEWRLPGFGQFIEEGHRLGDLESQKQGSTDREGWQRDHYPQRIGFDDNVETHLVHVNQFTDDDMKALAVYVEEQGFKCLELLKAIETVHEGHDCYNWLMAFERSAE